MKKIILPVLLVMSLAACKNSTTTDAKATASTEQAAGEVPTFADPEVNKGVAELNSVMSEFKAAIESKDAAKIQELQTKMQSMQGSMQSWAAKVKPEEKEKFEAYGKKMAKDMMQAAMNAMK